MIPFYAIICDYFNFIRYYFTIQVIFPIILQLFYDYTQLFYYNIFPIFLRLFYDYSLRLYAIVVSIIYDYFTASAPEKWECTDSNSSPWPNHGEMTG
jgi:hypothetical protein